MATIALHKSVHTYFLNTYTVFNISYSSSLFANEKD